MGCTHPRRMAENVNNPSPLGPYFWWFLNSIFQNEHEKKQTSVMTNIQTKIRKVRFLIHGRMTFSQVRMVAAYFIAILFTASLAYRTSTAVRTAVCEGFSHSCLPLFTNNMLLDSYVGNLFTPTVESSWVPCYGCVGWFVEIWHIISESIREWRSWLIWVE